MAKKVTALQQSALSDDGRNVRLTFSTGDGEQIALELDILLLNTMLQDVIGLLLTRSGWSGSCRATRRSGACSRVASMRPPKSGLRWPRTGCQRTWRALNRLARCRSVQDVVAPLKATSCGTTCSKR
jgi:hypothetical protein